MLLCIDEEVKADSSITTATERRKARIVIKNTYEMEKCNIRSYNKIKKLA